MDKRLAKRHKRQVSRARERGGESEPDVRTSEQVKAAREASRPNADRGGNDAVRSSLPSFRSGKAPGTGSASKTDA